MMRMRTSFVFGVAAVLLLSAVTFAAGLAPARSAPTTQSANQPTPHNVAGQARGRNHSHDLSKQDDAAPHAAAPAMTFATITVAIDPQGTPLAAYQFELRAEAGFKVVGLDNAGHHGFSDPPYYDLNAAANGTDRLIIADYALLPPDELSGELQTVAVVHAVFNLPLDEDHAAIADGLSLTLTTAADSDGTRIDADISYDLHFAQRQDQE